MSRRRSPKSQVPNTSHPNVWNVKMPLEVAICVIKIIFLSAMVFISLVTKYYYNQDIEDITHKMKDETQLKIYIRSCQLKTNISKKKVDYLTKQFLAVEEMYCELRRELEKKLSGATSM
ncbi:uncharacterized protein LOC121866182 [Homarus americanus]|uniref:uncharacterized protein LOC121866182 n=1 Tax=Homarus americanus TaxID=6706 RepID=UPI001C44714D|nr:uncharacterized protein LOC121866182 [Homarus americanus]